MREIVTSICFLLFSVTGFSQQIIGHWKTPKAPASIQYQFFAEGKMQFDFYGDLSSYRRKGVYNVINDSIFIQYDSLTATERKIYNVKGEVDALDTLFLINAHTIKLAPNFYCYNIDVPKTFSLTDSIFFKGQILRTQQILFDFAKSTIRAQSIAHLDSMATFLKTHTSLKIEISVHTDTRSSQSYSTCLSCNRARAIFDYLVAKGVNPSQLVYKGYEGRNPLIPDAEIKKMQQKELQEQAHQKNRRVEYKILEIESV
jgi:outer membrane protein OmpA-like peptidoglycan-associated protein